MSYATKRHFHIIILVNRVWVVQKCKTNNKYKEIINKTKDVMMAIETK